MKFRLLAVLLTLLCIGVTTARAADKPAQIVMGVSSTEDVIRDLEYLISDLAGQKKAFDDFVKPNIEVFLIGVDETRPVRFDSLFDAKDGYRSALVVPISNLKDFLNDNLNPIGITPKRTRTDKDLYELTGAVYTGWLRYLGGNEPYALISKVKEDVPKDVTPPAESHQALIDAGYLVFAQMRNEPGTSEGRIAAFEKFSTNLLDGIQKRPDETREAFDLRKKWSEQQLNQMRQWFVECFDVKLGLKIDRETKTSVAEMTFAALPETKLHASIDQVATQPSYFAAIPKPEKSVISLRVNWAIDEQLQAQYKEIYALSQPVADQAIRKDDEATAAVKEARVQFSQLVIEVLNDSLQLGVVDLFADLVPNGNHHNLLLGVRCQGQAALAKALAVLPAAEEGWEFKADVAEIEGVKIHELSVKSSMNAAIEKFYGASGIIYLGVGENTFWLATGDGAREQLDAAITLVRTADPATPNNVLVSMHIQALPLIQSLEDMSQEEGVSLIEELRNRGLLAPAKAPPDKPGAKKVEEKKAEDKQGKRQERAQQLANFKWRPIVLKELTQLDGEFNLQIQRSSDGVLTGEATSTEGVLRALGAMIGKFAEETLN